MEINFNFAIDGENRDHCLAIAEMFMKLAGEKVEKPEVKNVKTKAVETKAVETKAVETKAVETKEVETKAVETKEVETKVVETKEPEGLTLESLRAKGFKKATSDPACKDKIGAWLQEKGIKGVPAMPKDLFQEYDKFLDSL
jgi:hypothetical protein